MTVYFDKGRDAWRYDFQYLLERYISPRSFPTKGEAKDAEAELKRKLRRQAAGLEPLEAPASPKIHDWADVYLAYATKRQRLRDLAGVRSQLAVVLRFFGRRLPDATESGPYHDLSLRDVVEHPGWITAFEAWMDRRGVAGATRNHYRTRLSRLYAVAMLPEYRQATGITVNPFRGLPRDAVRPRTALFSRAQLAAVLAKAPPHLRLAIAIAALAPKLRLANILALRWDRNVAADLSALLVHEHKTAEATGRPLVAPVSAPLRRILEAAKAAQPKGVHWVIHQERRPVHRRRLQEALEAACEAAGVAYGVDRGVTFHTIRHTAATRLAALGVPEGLRKDVLGHLTIQTTQGYTHLQPIHEAEPLEQLASDLAIEGALAPKSRRCSRLSDTAPRPVSRGTKMRSAR